MTLAVILGSVGVRIYNARRIYFYVTVLCTHIFYHLRDHLLGSSLEIRLSAKPDFILVVFQVMRPTCCQMWLGSLFYFARTPRSSGANQEMEPAPNRRNPAAVGTRKI